MSYIKILCMLSLDIFSIKHLQSGIAILINSVVIVGFLSLNVGMVGLLSL